MQAKPPDRLDFGKVCVTDGRAGKLAGWLTGLGRFKMEDPIGSRQAGRQQQQVSTENNTQHSGQLWNRSSRLKFRLHASQAESAKKKKLRLKLARTRTNAHARTCPCLHSSSSEAEGLRDAKNAHQAWISRFLFLLLFTAVVWGKEGRPVEGPFDLSV